MRALILLSFIFVLSGNLNGEINDQMTKIQNCRFNFKNLAEISLFQNVNNQLTFRNSKDEKICNFILADTKSRSTTRSTLHHTLIFLPIGKCLIKNSDISSLMVVVNNHSTFVSLADVQLIPCKKK